MKKRMLNDREYKFFLVLASIQSTIILFALFIFLSSGVFAGIGTPSTTVLTELEIGNVQPEIINLSVSPDPLILTANATTNFTIYMIIRDYNLDDDIKNVSVVFYDFSNTTYNSLSDNNNRYYQNCTIDRDYGDEYEANATCIIPVWYYAHNASWNVSAIAYDNQSIWSDFNSTIINVNSLLALGLPDNINFGRVNATEVSDEKMANVTNFGNVPINLSLSGYAVTPGDNLAMNCSSGSLKNISIYYEKYNLTTSNIGGLTLSQFEEAYFNLTSDPANKTFNLNFRTNEVTNDAFNSTYWRIYVPRGVAGNCSGNIVFGAVSAPGS
jgi:hypothetical protein